jgi:hypothetical protein
LATALYRLYTTSEAMVESLKGEIEEKKEQLQKCGILGICGRSH